MNHPRTRFGLAVCLLAAIVSSAVLSPTARADENENGRGRHQRMFLVPTPGKVTIDGKLDDWDLSGQIFIYVTLATAEMQGAHYAMMYDADAMYVSGIVRDPTPMMNRHDPKIEGARGWDADVCQLYLCTDPDLGFPLKVSQQDGAVPGVMDMYLYYYTDRKEPALVCFQRYGYDALHPEWDKGGMIPADKFQGAFIKAEDGRGYTFEYRIPWTTLKCKRPFKAGDLTAGLVQFNWSDSQGLATAGGGAWAYDVMHRAGFPFQEAGCWGKFIFAEKGNLPKDMVEEGLPPEKPLPLTYDFDLPEKSEVTIQFFDDQNTIVRTLIAAGAREAGHNVERWDGLDYSGKPLAPGKYTWKGLYHQPITTKFLFSAHNSGQPPYHNDEGTGSWGADHGNPTCAVALDDGIILAWSIAEAGYGTIKTDLNGKKVWSSRHNATDIATDGKRLFVTGDSGYDSANSVKVFDAKDDRPLAFGNGKMAVEAPTGGKADDNIASNVAYADGKIYVSWPRRNVVCVYDATSGELKDTWTVPTPGALAARPDGSVAVISEGKILALKDGKTSPLISDHIDLSKKVGDPEAGRLNGMAVGPDGTIYVANSGKLQNISVFDASGKYLRSIGKDGGRPAVGLYDKTGIYEPGGIAIDKNGHLWVAETTDSPKRISEWDVKTGDLVNEFFGGSGYFGWAFMDPHHPDEIFCHNVIWKVDWKNNTCAPYSTIWRQTEPNMARAVDPNGYGGALRVISMKDGRQFAGGNSNQQTVWSMRDGDIFKPFAAAFPIRRTGLYAAGIQHPVLEDEKKYPDGRYYWKDANNDQTIQANEISTSDVEYNKAVGELYANVTDPVELEARQIGLEGSDFVRWDGPATNKKYKWAYRGCVEWHTAINLAPIKPGNMNGLTIANGVAGEFTAATSYFGVFNLTTTDGIYVAQGFRDGRLGGVLGPDVLCSETIIGCLVKPDGMNGRIFFLGGAADGRVTEILGLDTVKRLPGGEYVHSEEAAKKAADAREKYQAELAKGQKLVIVRGGLQSLDGAKPVSKILDGQRAFSVRTSYDDKNLYVRYDVKSPAEMTNEIPDPNIIFKGGNALDIQIAADPSADPKRKDPVQGDVRLVVTRQKDKTAAVLYRPRVKDFKGEPIVLKSPGNKESFEAIEVVSDKIGLTYAKQAGTFQATVTIPLSLIGWTPKANEQVKIDFGYLYGNATGTATAVRSYWTNNGFSAGVTNDVPNESKVEPSQWGVATVE